MYIVIAMAGESRRFYDLGFKEAKFKLIVRERPLFDWALSSLRNFYKETTFVFVSMEGSDDFISQRCRILGINSFKVSCLDARTDGQATTVMKGVQSLEQERPLFIYNIDTYINPDILNISDIKQNYDGWLLLFPAPGSHWSFAKVNMENKVIAVSEKVRISGLASTGLYYFKSISIFKDAYHFMKDKIKERYKEVYVAPLYNVLIENNKLISSKIMDRKDIVPLGTPNEVLRFDPEFFKRYGIKHDNNMLKKFKGFFSQ